MKPQIKYIELKTGYADNGPAWIAKVEYSKSGKMIYFNGRAFKGNGHGICFDIETCNYYWISGIKKNGQDRHWRGNGKIMVDRKIVREYLKLVDLDVLDPKKYELVDIPATDKGKFADIENSKIDASSELGMYQALAGLSLSELDNVIAELKTKEYYTNPNNGVKYYTIKRLEVEKYLEYLLKGSL